MTELPTVEVQAIQIHQSNSGLFVWSVSQNCIVIFRELWFVRHYDEVRTVFMVYYTVIIELRTVSLTQLY